MNRLTKNLEKLKIKTTPGGYGDLKNTCKKLQAIIDRRMYNESKNKVPSYKDELYFYSIFIPDLIDRMSYHEDFDDKLKMLILQPIINAWVKYNFTKCGKLVTIFNKEFPLTVEPVGSPGSATSPKRVLSSKKLYMSHSTVTPLKKRKSSSKK